MGSSPELQLVQRAKAGDREALRTLLSEQQDRVLRFGMRLCSNASDAEEVAQETLLTLAQSLPDFEGRSSLSTWLFAVARSFCAKKRRKSKFAPAELHSLDDSRSASQLSAGDSAAPDLALDLKQLQAALEQSLQALDIEQREVLMLRDIEGLSASEVAETLNISVSAVKSRLHRARVKLRNQLAPWLHAESEVNPSGGCPDILTLYSRHLENEIEPSVCRSMEQHLEHCQRCSAACASLKDTLAMCSSAASSTVPPELQRSVRRALEDFLAEVQTRPES